MRRSPRYLLTPLIAVALVPVGLVEAGEAEASYLALPHSIGISCRSDARTLVDPGFSPTPDPLTDPLGWLFSFEHECSANAAQNVVRERLGESPESFGYGAYRFRFQEEDLLSPASARAVDHLGVETHILMQVKTASGGEVSAEGCGLQTLILPEDPLPSWFAPHEGYPLWVWVHSLFVDEDLDTCIGSTGTLHGTWGHT